jgi:hypothetical protein
MKFGLYEVFGSFLECESLQCYLKILEYMWEIFGLRANAVLHTTHNPKHKSVVQNITDGLQATDKKGNKECRDVRSHEVAGHRAYNAITDTQTSQYFFLHSHSES